MSQVRNKQIQYDSAINFDSQLKITNLANGTVSTDAINLSQLQAVAAGYDPKASVRAASDAVLTLTTDYTRAGTGATHILTASTNGILAIDGVTTGWVDIDTDGATNTPHDPTQATRILIRSASDAADNGIYVVKDKGTAGTPWKLQRADDQDGTPASEVSTGNTTFVSEGTSCGGFAFVLINDGATTGVLTVDTNNLNWTKIGQTATFTAGAGIDATSLAVGTITLDLDGTSNGTSGLELGASGLSISDNIAGVGLTLASGVLSVELDELTAGTVDVAADSFAFTDASDSGNSKLESIADLMSAAAGEGLTATSGVIDIDILGTTIATSIATSDEMLFELAAGGLRAITFANLEGALSLENIQAGTAAGQVMIWDDTAGLWDNATLSAATGDRAGVSIVNADGAITLGVNIEAGTAITGAIAAGDKFLMYDATADANVIVTIDEISTYIDSTLTYDNYVSWTLSDGSNTQAITAGNTAVFAHGNGLQIVVGATDTATFTIVPDITGGANLASVVKLNANGIALGVDDITIEETAAGGNLRVKANGISANELNVSGNGLAGQVLTSDADGSFSWAADAGALTPTRVRSASSVVAAGEGVAVTDVFGATAPASTSIPDVYLNGVKVFVGNAGDEGTADCWFATGAAPAVAIAFSALTAVENIVWDVVNAGYALDASDVFEVRYSI